MKAIRSSTLVTGQRRCKRNWQICTTFDLVFFLFTSPQRCAYFHVELSNIFAFLPIRKANFPLVSLSFFGIHSLFLLWPPGGQIQYIAFLERNGVYRKRNSLVYLGVYLISYARLSLGKHVMLFGQFHGPSNQLMCVTYVCMKKFSLIIMTNV